MINTHGLTHLNLEVQNPDESLRFYQTLFGVREYYRDQNSIQVLGPGPHDVIAFERSDSPGNRGGISHFGFRLVSPDDFGQVLDSVKSAGARILRTGEFAPGCPYLYILDPDGYEIEIWYE